MHAIKILTEIPSLSSLRLTAHSHRRAMREHHQPFPGDDRQGGEGDPGDAVLGEDESG